MSCVIGLGNVIKLISCGNILYYKRPIQHVHLLKINMCHENNFNIQRKDQRSNIQKEFEYLACDEELKSKHVGGKKENQTYDSK